MKLIKVIIWAIKNRKVLCELAKAYITQDNRGTAFPIFYQIRDWEYVSVEEGYDEDCVSIYLDGEFFQRFDLTNNKENIFDAEQFLKQLCDSEGKDFEEMKNDKQWQEIKDTCNSKWHSLSNSLEDILSYVFNDKNTDYHLHYQRLEPVYKHCFLTEKDAEEHLKLNDYHYHKKADTWCEHAWRSNSMNKLNKLFEELAQ